MSKELEWPQEEGPFATNSGDGPDPGADASLGPTAEAAIDPADAAADPGFTAAAVPKAEPNHSLTPGPGPAADPTADPGPDHAADDPKPELTADPDHKPTVSPDRTAIPDPTADPDPDPHPTVDSDTGRTAEPDPGPTAALAEAAPPQEAGDAALVEVVGQGSELLLFTVLDADIGENDFSGGGAGDGVTGGEADQITLHSASVASDGPAKIETRLAVREALLPPRRSTRPRARPPRCRACGGAPGRGVGGYCDECTQAAGGSRSSSGGEESAVPPCADCGRQFDSVSSLVSHRTHEHGGPAHSCAFCSKTFQRRTDLKNHMNLHLGIKKCVCDVCGRQFSHMSNLYRHRRIHTGQ